MPVSELVIEKEIARYVHMLNPKQKKTVLDVVKTFAGDKQDWWDELTAEQLASIKLAEGELAEGKGIPHEEVLKKYAKWL